MTGFRKWMILGHRYLGIALSLLFVVWFVSGIGIMYTRGMPSLTPEMRLERLPALDLARVRLSLSEALDRALWTEDPSRVTLLMVMGRPAYRIGGAGESLTVFADDGEVLFGVGEDEALSIAGQFTHLAAGQLAYAGLLTEADQWTIGLRREMPLHKVRVDDAHRTELYIPEYLGEVTLMTTRGSRVAAWFAAIPHWLYFAPLRLNDGLWRQVVLWTSGLGCVLALAGIVVGLLQFSPSRPFRLNRLLSYIPYRGWMRWHFITGMVFGVFTLTWVFSGMLSMEPLFWSSRGGGLGAGVSQALRGGGLEPSLFPPIDPEAWAGALPGKTIKEIELLRIQGEPYFLARDAESGRSLVRANTLEVRRAAFSAESIMERVRGVYPDVPVANSELLNAYDSYYYPRGQSSLPLPVLRVKFDDPEKTWFYIDPGMSQLLARYHRLGRVERWIYNGLHSLDFGFWYYNRPLWDIGVIVLLTGGIASSGIGMFIGFKRLGRGLQRRTRPRPLS